MLNKKKILIAIKGFEKKNIYKQPWLWVNNFALDNLSKYEVYILTDSQIDISSKYKILKDSNFFKTYKSKYIDNLIPNKIYYLINPLSVLYFWRFIKIKNLYFIMGSSKFKISNLLMLSLSNFFIRKKAFIITSSIVRNTIFSY